MMNPKINILVRIIGLIPVILFLVWALFKNEFLFQIFILFFLGCSLVREGELICLLLEKEKIAQFLHRLFGLIFLGYWFFFLIVVDYISFQKNEITLILFSLIFWVAGIFLARKLLSKK